MINKILGRWFSAYTCCLPLTVTIHNYNFINCEDRIFLNRYISVLGTFDLQVTKKSFSLPSLIPLLPQIITDAAQGRWFPGSFCPHFPTLHPVSQWRVKGSLARSMIMRRCYVTIRLVKTEKNNTCSQWLCWDLECKYEINILSNSWIVSEAICMVEGMCVSMCMSVLVFKLYQRGRKTEGWTSTFKSYRVKQHVCTDHERAREQDPAKMDMLLWLRHPLVWHQDGATWVSTSGTTTISTWRFAHISLCQTRSA